jgi:hypothetical protein
MGFEGASGHSVRESAGRLTARLQSESPGQPRTTQCSNIVEIRHKLVRRSCGERHCVRRVVGQRCERAMIVCRSSVGGVEH